MGIIGKHILILKMYILLLLFNFITKVWVSHVDSPSEVWIQVASSELKVNLISIGEQSQVCAVSLSLVSLRTEM